MTIDSSTYRRLIDVGLALSAEKNIDSLLERILREAKWMVNADAGSLYLKTDNDTLAFAIMLNDTLGMVQGGNSGNPVSLPEVPLKLEDGSPNIHHIASRAAIRGETINIADAYDAEGIDVTGTERFDEITGYRSKSFLTVPLKNYAEETIGVLQLLNAKNDKGEVIAFTTESQPLIEALASQASVALENRYLLDEQEAMKKELEKEVDKRTRELRDALSKLSEAHVILKELTTIDAVTGIKNRQFFDDVFDQEWRRAVRQQYEISILMLDLDHFKVINDSHGHLVGDTCLAEVAREINGMINRPSDVVARYGGEEFVIILPYIENEKAVMLAEQIRERVEKTRFDAEGHHLNVTISIGVATVLPDETMDGRDLIAAADAALYDAKAMGRNRVVSTRAIGQSDGK